MKLKAAFLSALVALAIVLPSARAAELTQPPVATHFVIDGATTLYQYGDGAENIFQLKSPEATVSTTVYSVAVYLDGVRLKVNDGYWFFPYADGGYIYLLKPYKLGTNVVIVDWAY